MAEITNASKSPKPIQADIDLLPLLRKRATVSRTAALEFKSANRQDLADKEVSQCAIFEEYASKIDVLGEKEMEEAIASAMAHRDGQGRTPDLPAILRLLVGPQGTLREKAVDKAGLTDLVKRTLSTS